MPFNSLQIRPEQANDGARFWLRADGAAFEVSDHLAASQYAKAALADDDWPASWGYEDMFRRGWCRVHIDGRKIWADVGIGRALSSGQVDWLQVVARNRNATVKSAMSEATAEAGGEGLGPTNDFLRRLRRQ